jgi:hypothetical protein
MDIPLRVAADDQRRLTLEVASSIDQHNVSGEK